MNIVTTKLTEERIRAALKETLVGPGTDSNVAEDYPPSTALDMFPNFDLEGRNLDPSRKDYDVDDVVQFTSMLVVQGVVLFSMYLCVYTFTPHFLFGIYIYT